MPPHPLKTYLNLTASLPSPTPPPQKRNFPNFLTPKNSAMGNLKSPQKSFDHDPCYFPEYPHPHPPPPPSTGITTEKIPLAFAHFRRFCLLVSLRVQIFIVLRRLSSYDDSNTENT